VCFCHKKRGAAAGGIPSAREAYVAGLNGLLYPHRFVWAKESNVKELEELLAPSWSGQALLKWLKQVDAAGHWRILRDDGVLTYAQRK
jgi:hypothetical protein